MPFYKKKPVIVEARQFTSANGVELVEWCQGSFVRDQGDSEPYIVIPTLEGEMRATIGAYIVKGSQFGEFWSVKKEIFEATYEAVS